MGKSLSGTRLIVGLGNPGKEYEYTRHNLGFLVIRKLAEQYKFEFEFSALTNGMTAEGRLGSHDACLLMPLTYMNNSGVAVRQLLKDKRFAAENMLVVCDDLNLPFGELRIRSKGSDGGNNGLGSVIYHLNSDKFPRLRLGIGQPSTKQEAVDYVLGEFNKGEKKDLDLFIGQAVECCLTWINDGMDKAMEKFNRNPATSKD